MKFETLKTKCASFAYNNDQTEWGILATMTNLENVINGGKYSRSITLIKELKDKVYDAIMATDVRCISTLINAFPSVIPSWIKSGNYYIELTDNGWELLKK